MVDAMQSSRVGAAYLALKVAPATEGKHAQIVHGLLNETVPFLVPVPCLKIRPGQISRDCTIILGLKLPKSNNNSACSRRFFKSVKFLNQALRWLNTVLAFCDYMLFAKSWQEKGCSSQAETWQVKNTLMKDFD